MSENKDQLTLDQCVEEILKAKKLDRKHRVYKLRFRLGILSHEIKEKIVKEGGYTKIQEAKYSKSDSQKGS